MSRLYETLRRMEKEQRQKGSTPPDPTEAVEMLNTVLTQPVELAVEIREVAESIGSDDSFEGVANRDAGSHRNRAPDPEVYGEGPERHSWPGA